MEFIREEFTLPVPFNIIPMPWIIAKFFKRIFFCFFKRKSDSNPDIIEMPRVKVNGFGNEQMPPKLQNGGSQMKKVFLRI